VNNFYEKALFSTENISPLAPQREREPKANDFVAVLPFRCLLAKRMNQLGTNRANGLRAQAWHSCGVKKLRCAPDAPYLLFLRAFARAGFYHRAALWRH
jgi:hypothetical protein